MMRGRWLAFLLTSAAWSQAGTPATRSFAFPEAQVKAALHELVPAGGGKLPALDGFASGDAEPLTAYEQPYYRLQIETHESGGVTEVQVAARITAWRDGYRSLPSNGRLEADLLERLSARLTKRSALPEIEALEKEIAEVRFRAEQAEQLQGRLEAEIRDLREAGPAAPLKLVAVKKPGAPLFDRPAAGGRIILRAEPEDEFEVVEERGAWIGVRSGANQTSWIRRSGVELALAGEPQRVPEPNISREQVREFSGDWPVLKGKLADFIWLGESPDQWHAATRLFAERYLIANHQPQGMLSAPAGFVLIFSAPQPAIAACGMRAIRKWVEGELSETAFASQCSLDPPAVFQAKEKSITHEP
jgi:hypothetical protein